MATAKKSATKKSSGSGKRKSSAASDAYALLSADHAEAKRAFEDYQSLVDDGADADERQELAQKICMLLTVHATIEEEIFYPAAREVLDEDDASVMDEADVEHASAMELIAFVQDGHPDEEYFDARVKVLGEYVEHHATEEENEMFAKLKDAGLDADAVGEELMTRKEELLAEGAAEE